jgi:hypothetical protein
MKKLTKGTLAIAALVLFIGLGCKKKNKDIVLPDIDGYSSSDAVASANLVAYWPLDGSGNEKKTNTAPTSTVGATYEAGVKGQAVSLNAGYLYYATPLGTLTSNQPFTLSAWIQVTNNGLPGGNPPTNNFPYSYFQSAIAGQLFGNLTAMVEAGQYNVASDTLVLKSIYKDLNNGTQDNINNYGVAGTEFKVVKKAGTTQWVHVVTTYNPAGGTGAQSVFRIYGDTVLVSNKNFENRGANSFKYTAGEVIIGGWYNNIPGKTVSADTWTQPFKGKIDEIRLYNKLLTIDEIKALYNLGKAGR